MPLSTPQRGCPTRGSSKRGVSLASKIHAHEIFLFRIDFLCQQIKTFDLMPRRESFFSSKGSSLRQKVSAKTMLYTEMSSMVSGKRAALKPAHHESTKKSRLQIGMSSTAREERAALKPAQNRLTDELIDVPSIVSKESEAHYSELHPEPIDKSNNGRPKRKTRRARRSKRRKRNTQRNCTYWAGFLI